MKTSIQLIPLVIVLFLGGLQAQNFEMQMRPDSVSALDFQYRKLLLPNAELEFYTGNYDLRYRHAFGKRLNGIANMSYSTYNDAFFGQDLSGFSNLYLGLQFKGSHKENNINAIEAGVYVPTASENSIVGVTANYYELPKFIDQAVTFHASYKSYYNYSNGFNFGYEIGPDLLISTDDEFEDEVELLMRYAVNLSYHFSDFFVMSELWGLAIITEEDGSFGDRTIHNFTIGAGYKLGKFVPRVYYKDFIDNDAPSIDGVIGVGVFLAVD